MLEVEEGPVTLADRLIIGGALAFLVGTAAATFLYAKDPYELTLALFSTPPMVAWPFYLGSAGILALVLGGVLAYVRHA